MKGPLQGMWEETHTERTGSGAEADLRGDQAGEAERLGVWGGKGSRSEVAAGMWVRRGQRAAVGAVTGRP